VVYVFNGEGVSVVKTGVNRRWSQEKDGRTETNNNNNSNKDNNNNNNKHEGNHIMV